MRTITIGKLDTRNTSWLKPMACMWINEGTSTDLKNARRFAQAEGYKVFVFPVTEPHPLEKTRELVERRLRIRNGIVRQANDERSEGGSIRISLVLPSIEIRMSDGTEYFFQEHEADALIAQYEPLSAEYHVSIEDAILSSAQGW